MLLVDEIRRLGEPYLNLIFVSLNNVWVVVQEIIQAREHVI